MNKVVKILMDRDGLSEEEAIKQYEYARECIVDAQGDYTEVEDIMYGELGLEMDYIFDMLN